MSKHNAAECARIGRSARQQNALKQGLYTREAIAQRRQVRDMIRQSRALLLMIE
jgi:hypothetical protein